MRRFNATIATSGTLAFLLGTVVESHSASRYRNVGCNLPRIEFAWSLLFRSTFLFRIVRVGLFHYRHSRVAGHCRQRRLNFYRFEFLIVIVSYYTVQFITMPFISSSTRLADGSAKIESNLVV